MKADYSQFFSSYVQCLNEAWSLQKDLGKVQACFSDSFLSGYANSLKFEDSSLFFAEKIYTLHAFNSNNQITELVVESCEPIVVDSSHDMVKVIFKSVSLDQTSTFSITYFFHSVNDQVKIFALVTTEADSSNKISIN